MDIDVSYFSDEQQGIIEVIGMEAYRKLVESYGGCSIYIAKKDKLEKLERNFEICRKFNGFNYKALAKEYDLCENTIREITAEKAKTFRNMPMEGQLKLW